MLQHNTTYIKAEKEENETVCKKDHCVLYRFTDKLTFSFNVCQKF